jgi:hypothetical protein
MVPEREWKGQQCSEMKQSDQTNRRRLQMEQVKPGPVSRVRVRWREGRWVISDERQVPEMVIPNSQPLPRAPEGQQVVGFWFEVTDPERRLLYRRIIEDPLRQRLEIPLDDGRFTNVPVERKDITFEVLIPDSPENATLSFFGTVDGEPGRLAELKLRESKPRSGKSEKRSE